MKRIISLILTAAMLFSMIAVSASAAIDHADVTNGNKNVFSAELSTQDTLMPGDTFTLTVSADSFWGDQSLTTEDPDLGTATGAYGPAIFTVGAVFDTSAIQATKAPTLATDTTIGNGEYMSAQMPTKKVMNDSGIATVMVTASQIINDDEDGYITFYGSGDVVTFNFEIAENAYPGTYYIYLGDYMAGTEDKYDEIIDGKYVRYNAAVDPYAAKLDRGLSEYPAPIAINVGSNASEEDLAAAANVENLIANIGTILYKEKQLIEVQDKYVRFDSVNHQSNYMHVSSIGFNTGLASYVDIEFYPNEGCNPEFNFGFIGGTTNANNSFPCIFYNTGTKTFMIAGLDGWVNPSQVWPGELFAESEPIIAEDGEFIKATFIYEDGYLAVEVDGEIVVEYEMYIDMSFYIFYPTWADFYLKSMTLNDGVTTVSVDGTDLDAVGNFFGAPGSATLTLENFKFYSDSTKKLLEAEAAYAALTDAQKALVRNYADLVADRAEFNTLAGKYVDNLIDAIGTVKFNPTDATKDSLAAIVAAEEAFAELNEDQKALVTKLDTLTAARERWNTLNAANDAACASDVDALIDAIGEVNFDSRSAIETARAAYEALTDAQKALVTKLATLVAAEETFAVYGPIMTAEAAILAIKPFMQSKDGMIVSFDFGYSNMTDNGNSVGTEGAVSGTVGDVNMTFDFMYTSYNSGKHPIIGMTLNGYNVGYDVECQKFTIGPGGYGTAANDGEWVATYDYAIAPYQWVNMGITTTAAGDVYIYVDGEVVCEAHEIPIGFNLFWMNEIECYFANFESDRTFGNEMGAFKPVVIDLYNVYDQTALVDAARAAVDALNAEQLELLGADLIAILEAAEAELADLEAELKADAADVDALIEAIVDAETYNAANAAFEGMYPSAKQYLTKTDDLANAAIIVVEDAINAIGDVTLGSLDAIVAAETAYGALSAAQKAQVKNYDVLVAARDAYSALKAAEVDAVIDALGAADSITLESLDAIVAAEQAYAALTDAEKALVTKLDALTACRDAYSALRAAAVDALIDAIGEVTLESTEAISVAEQAYNGLSNAEKAFVTKKADLDAAKATLVSLSTGHQNVINLINSLYFGGTGTKAIFNGNTYTQLATNPNTTEFTFAYAMMNPVAQASGDSHTIGGGTDNGVWAGYDVDRQAFVVYKDFNLFGDGDYGTNDAYVVASYPMTLAADTWYFVELTFSVNGVSITVDGVEVVNTADVTTGSAWFIYYPRNTECFFDAFTYTLDGAVIESTTDWSGVSTPNWIGHDGGNWKVVSGLGEATASDALVVKVLEMYNALNDTQKALVTNYDKLEALIPAEQPSEEDLAAAARVENLISSIGTVLYKEKQLIELEDQYVRFDSINTTGNYMHIGAIPFDTGIGTIDIEFYPNEGSINGFGYIGGTTNADAGYPTIFYNTGTNTFMIACTNHWVNPAEVTALYAESEPIIPEDGEFIKAKFIYDELYLAVEVDGEIVCEVNDVHEDFGTWIDYNFYIFYPTGADFYLKSMVLNDGVSEVVIDGTSLDSVRGAMGGPATTTFLDNFRFYSDSTKKLLEAENAYAELTDAQKALVANYADLVAARETYNTLAGQYVDNLIDAIGEVKFDATDATLDSLAAIVAAEEAYAELDATQKALVTKLDTLTAARATWDAFKAEYDAAEAAKVDALIDAIGEVDYTSRAAIEAARAAYDALTDAQKALVTKYDTLVAAEEVFAIYLPVLEAEAAILAIKPFMQAKNAYHLNYSQGYSNMTDASGNSVGNAAACVDDVNINFDFMYVSFKAEKTPIIGITLNGTGVGYDLANQRFVIGPAGFATAPKFDEAISYYDYPVAAGEWVNMGITTTVDGDVYVSLNGEVVCEAHDISVSFNLFWIENVECYFANFESNYKFANENGNYKPLAIDIYAPFDQVAAVTAARAAVDALTDEQLALLGADTIAILEAYEAELVELEAELLADAAAIDALIEAIVDADSYAAANAAYEGMYPSAKQYVTKLEDLKNAAIVVVENAINAIGTVTLDSIDALLYAESQYAALSAAQKAQVKNYDVLVAARDSYSKLMAAGVDAIIDALGSADAITLESIDAIVAAEQAYAALTDAEKAYVTKLDALQACRDAYSALRAAAVDALIDAIGEVTLESGDVIAAATEAYNGLSNAEKAFVTKKSVLDAAKATYTDLSAGHNNVINLIDSLYYGGSGVKVDFNGNTYTQLANNPGTLEFTFAYAMMNPSAKDGATHTIGGGVDNGVWAGYDLDTGAFAIYKDFNLFGESDSKTLVDSYAMDLAADTWYFVELTFSTDYVVISVNGEEILRTTDATTGSSWFIYYPRNVVAYFDAFVYTLDGAVMEACAEWTSPSTNNWIAHDGGNWSVVSGLAEGLAAQPIIDMVVEMYNALTDTQKSLVTNYDKLAALIGGASSDDVQEIIDGLGDFVVDLDDLTVLESADAIAEAYAAYNALSADEQANVNADALFAALEAYNKALYYDVILNDKYVAPSNVTAVDNVDSIRVSWDAVDNAVCYWVYVDGVVVLRTTDTSAIVGAHAGDHTVKVQVAINEDPDTLGIYGAYASGTSAEAAVVVTASNGFTVSVQESDTQAFVSWTEYEGAVLYYVKAIALDGSEIAIYKITDLASLTVTLPKLASEYKVVAIAYVNDSFINTAPVVVNAK